MFAIYNAYIAWFISMLPLASESAFIGFILDDMFRESPFAKKLNTKESLNV